MQIEFNKITSYSRLFSILFFLGAIPSFVFYVGREYQRTVNVLSYGKDTAYELHATGTYDKKRFVADGGAVPVESNLDGDWVNERDPSFVLRFEANNSFFDIYDGEPVASGSWVVRDSLPDTRFANLEKGMYLEKNSLSLKGVKEVLYYKVLFIDKKGLALQFLERDSILSFARRVATSTIRSEIKQQQRR